MKKLFFTFKVLLLLISSVFGQHPIWTNYTCGKYVTCITEKENLIWAGTPGGLVQFDKNNGTRINYIKTNSGLPQNSVSSISIDSSGTKWIGTDHQGLVRYDGINWVVYDTSNTVLESNVIKATAIDHINNIIWVATQFRIYSFDGNQWTYHDPDFCGLELDPMVSLFVDSYGRVWAGSQNALFVNEDGNWTVFHGTPSGEYISTVRDIKQDDSGNVWFSSTYVFASIDSTLNHWKEFDINSFGGIYPGTINEFDFDSNGTIWMAASSDMFSFDEDTLIIHEIPGIHFTKDQLNSIFIDDNDKIWLGSRYFGIISVSNNNWQFFSLSQSGLPQSAIADIKIDEHDNKWIGSGSGVTSFDDFNWQTSDTSNSPIIGNFIDQVEIDNNNVKWFGNFLGGVSAYKDNSWNNYLENTDRINAIEATNDGGVWIGTKNRGIYFYNGSTFTYYNSMNSPLPNNRVHSIMIDNGGKSWFAMGDDHTPVSLFLVTYDNGQWEKFYYPGHDLPREEIHAMDVDDYNVKWMGTYGGGIFSISDTDTVLYDTENSGLPSNWIFSVDVDENGIVWIGTSHGLTRFDGINWFTYDIYNSGLPDNYVTTVEFDQFNTKWIGTLNGMTSFNEDGIPAGKNEPDLIDTPIVVFPNPASDFLTIKMLENCQIEKVVLSNIQGRVLYSDNNSTIPGCITIKTSDFQNGVYILVIKSNIGHFSEKVIINR